MYTYVHCVHLKEKKMELHATAMTYDDMDESPKQLSKKNKNQNNNIVLSYLYKIQREVKLNHLRAFICNKILKKSKEIIITLL